MPLVLTTDSVVSCDHPPTGGGPLSLTPAAVGPLKVGGATVLSGSLAPTSVGAGCTQPTGQGSQTCTKVLDQSAGQSTVLRVLGRPVLLYSAHGHTDGLPDSNWSVKSAQQTLLKAD
jgi:hypothetical protein